MSQLIPKNSLLSNSHLSGLSAYSPLSCFVTVCSLVDQHSATTDFLLFQRRCEFEPENRGSMNDHREIHGELRRMKVNLIPVLYNTSS
jgi:hypothetical protein